MNLKSYLTERPVAVPVLRTKDEFLRTTMKSIDLLNGSDEFELSSERNPSDEDGI